MSTKKQCQQFNDKVEETLLGYGAIKVDTQCSGFSYQLETDAGLLNVSCHEAEKSDVLSIFLRFDDYEKAVIVLGRNDLGMNPKWNIHTAGTIEDAIGYLNYKLQKVNAIAYC